jgi:hypothetical protein
LHVDDGIVTALCVDGRMEVYVLVGHAKGLISSGGLIVNVYLKVVHASIDPCTQHIEDDMSPESSHKRDSPS